MGHWNYRVMRKVCKHSEGVSESFGIHEVFYDDDGEPHSCTVEPMTPYGENYYELKADLNAMYNAFNFPPLDYDDLKKEVDGE